jgi:hypothetical protein
MRPRPIFHLALLALAAAAQPAMAGVAYVPVTANLQIEGVDYQTVLWISNVSDVPAGFSTRFIPTNTDGTPAAGQSSSKRTLAPGGTFFLRPLAPTGQLGLLEITTDAGMVAEARLVGTPLGAGQSLGAAIPVVTSANISAANHTVVIQGFERDANRKRSNLGVVNLGDAETLCSISFFQANNVQIQQTAVIGVPPFSQREFYDALNILGQVTAEHVRASISCDRPFFPYSTIYDVTSGEVAFATASLEPNLTSTIPNPDQPAGECPDGAICFSRPGTFYRPTPGETVRRETFELDNGSYTKIHFRVEVFHGGWRNPTDGFYSLFWLAINRHFRLIGFSGFHGPNKNDVLFRHGMDLPAGDKPKFTESFIATPGQTYVCDFLFDAAGHHLVYNLLDTAGHVLVSITDRPNVNRIEVGNNEDLVADFSSLLGANANEPPTYGWEYRNLTVEVYH